MKYALVTGASGGIGEAAARCLARDGFCCALHGCRNLPKVRALARELGGIAVAADFENPAAIDEMAESVLREFPKIDLLVNSAGVGCQGLFGEVSDDDARRVFAVNVGGVMRVTKRFLPGMLSRHSGAVVNIASVWGETGASCEVHYSAAKAAVIGFTKALAKEVAPSGVRVNCVSPGVIDTPMNASLDALTMAGLAEETPLGRIGTPEEAAEAVAFLGSERAAFITGHVLAVNGGFYI